MLTTIRNYTSNILLAFLSFRSSSQKCNRLVQQCYCSSSMQARINALKQFDVELSQFQQYQLPSPNHILNHPISIDKNCNGALSHPNLHIELPSDYSFTFTTGKQLHQYHRTNKTQPNIIILHSLAFIQLNAFLAYADTLFRFAHHPGFEHLWTHSYQSLAQFKREIKRIAIDEGEHFLLLSQRLQQLGCRLGSIPVISSLHNVIMQTQSNLVERLALISIAHEGTGIKSIDRLINKLATFSADEHTDSSRKERVNDIQSAQILRRIKQEQKYHYETGLKWVSHFCRQQYQQKKEQSRRMDHNGGDKGDQRIAQQYSFQEFMQKRINAINTKYKCRISLSQIKI